MAAWRWVPSEDGKSAKGAAFADGSFYETKPIGGALREEISSDLDIGGAVWGILYSARQSFAVGTADYDNAAENLSFLVKELAVAQERVTMTLLRLASFVDAPVWDRLGALETKIGFAKDLLRNLPSEAPKQ